MKPTKSRIAFNIFNYISLILLTLVFVVPYIYIISASLSDEVTFVKNGFTFLPKKWSLEAYHFLLTTDDQMLRSIGNSLILTIGGMLVSTSVSMLYAYPLSKQRQKVLLCVYDLYDAVFRWLDPVFSDSF